MTIGAHILVHECSVTCHHCYNINQAAKHYITEIDSSHTPKDGWF